MPSIDKSAATPTSHQSVSDDRTAASRQSSVVSQQSPVDRKQSVSHAESWVAEQNMGVPTHSFKAGVETVTCQTTKPVTKFDPVLEIVTDIDNHDVSDGSPSNTHTHTLKHTQTQTYNIHTIK